MFDTISKMYINAFDIDGVFEHRYE
jgi:hypothetical protein